MNILDKIKTRIDKGRTAKTESLRYKSQRREQRQTIKENLDYAKKKAYGDTSFTYVGKGASGLKSLLRRAEMNNRSDFGGGRIPSVIPSKGGDTMIGGEMPSLFGNKKR